ncbi:hypothetical protein ACFWBB_40875 [Streptomyces sp. NPDC060000]|uniref:hypothetical protein n=1 Tax=Streptomyces sp. NPDC060000 TaxID=3347031 RepID=UPI00369C0A35
MVTWLAGTQYPASANEAKQRAADIAGELADIAMEELGIKDALDCFTTGNLGACGATVFNVASSFAGGLAGKLAKKYGLPWKWDKAAALGKRIWGLVKKLGNAVKDWFKSGKLANKAEEAAVEAGGKRTGSKSGTAPWADAASGCGGGGPCGVVDTCPLRTGARLGSTGRAFPWLL